MFKKLSIANKTFLAFLSLTVFVIGIVGALTFWQARNSLTTLAFEKLTSVRELKANQIEDYLRLISNQVETFSKDRMVIDAMRQLESAHQGLTDELAYDEERLAEIDAGLEAFYDVEFMPRLRRNLQSDERTRVDYLPKTLSARVLQHLYLSGNPYQIGSKDFLTDPGDGSDYSRIHAEVHPIFRDYLQTFGYYDIFLIDAGSGEIIYSVFKEVDFGTSLLDGPYAFSGLGSVFREARGATSTETVEIDDFRPYRPSYNRPAAFVASPIFDDGELIGVLAFQMPIDRINGIMTNDQNWSAVGLGQSGETYIVAEDFRLRNQSRFLIEDSENYFRMIESVGTPQTVIEQIMNLDSTIGLQQVRTVGTEAALAGETDTRLFEDYRGVPVLSSYRPLAAEGLNWVIMSEIDAAEAFGPIGELARRMVIIIAFLLIAVFAAAVLFSRTLTRPLAILRENSNALADGDLDVKINTSGHDEIGDLARDFERMRQSLKKAVDELKQLNIGLERKVEERTADLRNSEERVRSILRNAADGIIVIDEQGVVQVFNPSAETLFGRGADEVVGQNVKMLMPERYSKDHDEHLERYHSTGEKRIIGNTREVVGMRKDGSEFPMELHVGEAVLDEEKIFVGIVRDITERKQFEKEIADNLSFVTTLVDSVPNPIFVKDTSGQYVNFNRAYEKSFGIRREDFIGKSILDIDFFSEEYRNTRHEEDTRLLRDGGHEHREMSVTLGDGEEHDMLFWARAFDLSDGSRGGVLGVFVDISQQKDLERQLSIANKRMGDELNIGRQIQMSMIPLTFPRFPEHKDLDVWAHIRPAREVGGDFYDFFMIDDRYFAFVIADVSGKGVPAALLMAVAKTLLKSRSQDTKSTARIVSSTNDELSENNDECMFITAFFGILDTKTGDLTYTNAGHNPPYLMKTDGAVRALDELHGPMIGVMPGAPYGEAHIKLNADDKIVLYTDGVTEAFDASGQDYGEGRLEAFIERSKELGTKNLVEALVHDVEEFVGGAEQSDDITLFCIRFVAWDVRDDRGTVELHLTNDLAEIDRCQAALEEICERFELPAKIRNDFSVVLDDLLNNVINYAFEEDGEHFIDVVLSTDGQRFIVSVTDGGIEFDPFKLKAPDIHSGLEERTIGGLGIHLIRNLMDDHSYRRVDGKNVTTLMKRIEDDVPKLSDETTKD